MRYTPISELYKKVRERKLTPQEIEDREKIAKKLPMDDFKKRYGKDAMAVKMATATNIVKKKSDMKEDGHTDVASAIRQCKTVTEDAMQILQKLKSMSPEDSLPSWWTNKLAVASNSMNKLRDYFLVPSVSEEVELEEAKYQVNYSKNNKLFSKTINAKSEDDAEEKFLKMMAMKKINITDDDIRSVVKEEIELDEKAGDIPDLQKLIGELQNASKMHLAQSKRVQAHVDMMTRADAKGPEGAGGLQDLKKIVGELEKASQAHLRQSKSIDAHVDFMNKMEEVQIDETIVDFDYSRNPKGIYNAFMQMSRRLGLTLFNAPTGMTDLKNKGTGRIGATKSNMVKFMKYLNSKGIEPKVEIVNEEVELDEAMKYTHAVVDFKRSLKKFSDAKVIGFATNEKDAKFMAKNNLKGKKGTVVKLKKPMSQKKGDMMINRPLEEEKNHIKELIQSGKFTRPEIKKMIERNILEQRSATGYTLFHRSFSDAMQHAYAFARVKMGMTVDPKEIDNKVATGPRKPSPGKSNSYSLKTNKGMLQIQVYNTGGGAKPFELNMYSS